MIWNPHDPADISIGRPNNSERVLFTAVYFILGQNILLPGRFHHLFATNCNNPLVLNNYNVVATLSYAKNVWIAVSQSLTGTLALEDILRDLQGGLRYHCSCSPLALCVYCTPKQDINTWYSLITRKISVNFSTAACFWDFRHSGSDRNLWCVPYFSSNWVLVTIWAPGVLAQHW